MQLINYKDPRPIFEQIVENFKMQILMGVLAPGEQMPSVRTLAVELSTNPNTVQKAYIILEQQGYIYSVKGKGNFVATVSGLLESKKEEIIDKMKKLITETQAIGFDPQEIFELAVLGETSPTPLLREKQDKQKKGSPGAEVVRDRFTQRGTGVQGASIIKEIAEA